MKWIVIIVLLLGFTVTNAHSQTKCDTASKQAKIDHSERTWTGIGAALPIISIGAAYVYKTEPKDTLILKDSIALDCYQSKAKNEQVNSSITGSVYGLLGIIVFSIIF